jgi:hypothetical protein
MSLCALCGTQLVGDAVLCSHHCCAPPEGWADVNRLMCDFLHRGIVPPGADGGRELLGYMTEAA